MSATEERIAAEDAADIPAVALLRRFPVDHAAIWCEVIMQALDDARGSTNERQKARDFLLSDSGEWAESRRAVCDGAGIDEAYLRTHAARRIAEYDAGRSFKSARGHITIERGDKGAFKRTRALAQVQFAGMVA